MIAPKRVSPKLLCAAVLLLSSMAFAPAYALELIPSEGPTLGYVGRENQNLVDPYFVLTHDEATISKVEVIITNFVIGSGDTLNFDRANGINGGFSNVDNGSGIVLTMEGTATIAQYQQAIRSVRMQANNTGNRILRYLINGEEAFKTVIIAQTNTRPTSAAQTITINEDDSYTFSAADFPFIDSQYARFSHIRITIPITRGSLTFNGIEVTDNTIVPANQLDLGQLVFTPIAQDSRSPYADLKFRVHDGFDESNQEYISTINVLFVNDIPVITTTVRNGISENTSISGELLLTYTALDEEDGNVTSSVALSNNANGYYSLNSGSVFVTQAGIDFVNAGNTLPNIELSIEDSGGETGTSSTAITTTLSNDTPQVSLASSQIVENLATNGSIAAFITATDEETTPIVSFSAGTNGSQLYTIVGNTVQLTQLGADFINAGGFIPRINITVTDSVDRSLTASASISANVLAINDAPTITISLGDVLRERTATNGTLVASFNASDEDGTPTVSLTSNTQGFYRLIGNNIQLTQAGADSVNNGNGLPNVTVTATDDADSSLRVTASATPVIKAYNYPPELTLTLRAAIIENTAGNGTVVANYSVIDNDGTPSLIFTEGTNLDNYYKIVGNTIVLTQAGADYLNKGNDLPLLSLTAIDNKPEDELSVTVSVSPITIRSNDTPEITLTLDNAVVEENATSSTIVASFVAIDEEDTPNVDFTIGTNTAGYYRISGSSVLLTQAGANFVNGSGILPTVSLTAKDSVNSALSATDAKTPITTAFNDTPSIRLSLGAAIVENSATEGSVVANFVATDEDGNPSVIFTGVTNAQNYFVIKDSTVVLTQAGADFVNAGGTLPTISLTVVDDSDNLLTQIATITPLTTLTNDTPKIAITLSNSITEGSANNGTLVANFVASDEDGTPSVAFTSGSNSNAYYRIVGTTVVLTQAGADLVNTGGALPALSLTAIDDTNNTLTDSDTQTPTITPYNDPPEITLTLGANIIENSAIDGTLVARFVASDEDGTPSVSFTSASNTDGYYSIINNTIVLTQTGADFVNAGNALPVLSLTATDDLDNTIQITDAKTPIITPFNDTPTISITLSAIVENSAVDNSVIASFAALDEDGTPTVTFTAGTNANGYYKLSGTLVQLTQAAADVVNKGDALPSISLTATDDSNPALTSTDTKVPVITPFNDLPVITLVLAAPIIENSASDKTVVASYTVSDEDGTPLVNFTSGTNIKGYYKIVANNVELTTAGADFVNDGGTLPELSLTATDNIDNAAKVTASQLPIITPVNDAPKITLILGKSVDEDLATNSTVVATFVASDEDGKPIVSFTPGTNSPAAYEIVGSTIELTLAGAILANDTVALPLLSLTVTDDVDAQLTAVSIVQPIVIPNADKDFDGIPNTVEGTDDVDGDGIPNQEDTDSDGDGIPDKTEGVNDSDGDGTPDYLDSTKDEDGDGVPDIIEGTIDSDGDGIANFLDTDSDNDGISDGIEVGVSGKDSDGDTIDDYFDFDLTKGSDLDNDGVDESVLIPDTDKDGIPDYLDIDSDNDRIPDFIEYSLITQDPEKDGLPNHLDPDSDNDGISDSAEAKVSFNDSDNDGIDDTFDVDQTGGIDADDNGIDDTTTNIPDSDGDGVLDMHDLDSDNDGLFDTEEARVTDDDYDGLANKGVTRVTSPIDTDKDGIADFRDLDSNGDGIYDIVGTAAEPFDIDGDGRINPSTNGDRDGDGIDYVWDRQPDIYGSSGDLDGDGVIDSLDPDMDGDGIPNIIEDNSDFDGDGIPNHRDLDSDNDGIPDRIENLASGHDHDDQLDSQDLDSDNDGISDYIEAKASNAFNGDSDSDGVLDYIDPDSDNDGLSDAFESGRPALSGFDSDRDGIDDTFDADKTGGVDLNKDGIDDKFVELDSDGDGIPNYLDNDSDNDGIPDAEEQLLVVLSNLDSDGDGIDDAVDVDITGGIDANKDGIDDNLIDTIDMDNDGLLNYVDINSDGDYMEDAIEYGDFNRDGIMDYKQVNGNVKTGVKGGGSVDYLLAMLLLGLASFRILNVKKKNLVILGIFCLSLFSINLQAAEQKLKIVPKKQCSAGSSFFQSQCWYIGAGVGLSFVNPEPAENSVWVVDENKDSSVKLHLGLSLSEHWFSELSYENLGAATLSNLNPNVLPSTESIDYSALSFNTGYRLRGQSKMWDVYAKLGFTSLMTGDQEVYITQDHSGQVSFAAGAEWRFSKKWFSRLEFTSYDQDAKSVGISVSRYFGFNPKTVQKKKPKKKKLEKLQIVVRPKKPLPLKSTPALPPPVMLAPIIVRPPKDWKKPSHTKLDQDGDSILDELDECPNSPDYAEVDPRGCPLLETIILNVKFDSKSSLVKREYLAEIDRVAAMIKRYGNAHLTIEGHTDWDGTQAENQPLSESRAAAIADLLKLRANIASKNFTVIGYGELKPIADNSTSQGKMKNQRIVIIISQQ